jgi:TonB family protein
VIRKLHSFTRALSVAMVAFAILVPASVNAQDGRKAKTKVAPQYPELAKKMSISGSVKVQIVITPSGNVKEAKAIGGHPVLVGPAEDAAKKWKYEPAAEETTTILEFKFSPQG